MSSAQLPISAALCQGPHIQVAAVAIIGNVWEIWSAWGLNPLPPEPEADVLLLAP